MRAVPLRGARRAGLRADPGVDRLLRALALCEGFGFYVLLCPSPEEAAELFVFLPTELAALRGGAVHLVRIDPYESVAVPLAIERLREVALRRLLEPAPGEFGDGAVWALDASGAVPRDEEAWAWLLTRLNERRNEIMHGLTCPLVLCLPVAMETLLPRYAPDLWSVRSATFHVTTRVVREPLGPWWGVVADMLRLLQPEEAPGLAMSDYGDVSKEVAAARQRAAAAPEDSDARLALLIWLARQAAYEEQRGNSAAAQEIADEVVAYAHEISGRVIRPEEHLILASSLSMIGRVFLLWGDLQRAKHCLLESQRLAMGLPLQLPNRSEGLNISFHTFSALGLLSRKRGDWLDAARYLDQACEVAQSLALLEPEPEKQERIISAYREAGSAYRFVYHFGLGGRLMAQQRLEAACETARALHEAHPSSPSYLRIYLQSLAEFVRDPGIIDPVHADAVLEIAVRLLRQVPLSHWSSPDWAVVMFLVYLETALRPKSGALGIMYAKEAEAGLSDALRRAPADQAKYFSLLLALTRLTLLVLLLRERRLADAISCLRQHRRFLHAGLGGMFRAARSAGLPGGLLPSLGRFMAMSSDLAATALQREAQKTGSSARTRWAAAAAVLVQRLRHPPWSTPRTPLWTRIAAILRPAGPVRG